MHVCPPSGRKWPRPPLLIVAPLVLLLPVVGGGMLSRVKGASGEGGPLTCTVRRVPFVHELPVKGELESSRNTEVRCEVRSRNHSWVRILEVVEEGTYVQPGDFLIRLDSSQLESERNQQLIIVERARAYVINARTAYESACVAKAEYLNGEYALARQTIDRTLEIAKNRQQTSRAYLEASRALYERGYISAHQLQADEFALKAASTELAAARTKLRILDKLTRPKRTADLESAVAVGKVKLEAAEFALARNEEMLAEIDDQIAKCTIYAPVAGEVVLAHLHHNGHSHMVQPGEFTMQNRVLIRLPDPRNMQVRLKLGENKVTMVRSGMTATMLLEAFPNVELRGEVIKVNEYPEPAEWLTSSIKEYVAMVNIETPMAGMRPGLTAEVTICVDEIHEALQIATQAVLPRGETNHCIVFDGQGFEAREVTLGPNNGRTVVVESGLDEGDCVVLRPAAFLDRVELADDASEFR